MSKDEDKKARTLSKDARDASLEQAAAMLTAIHTAKQVSAEVLPTRDGTGSLNPLNPNVRVPLGDLVFGIAQIQVDFARKLFEFNRNASVVLRDRMRKNHALSPQRRTIDLNYPCGKTKEQVLKITNSASLSKIFNLRANPDTIKVEFDPRHVTIAAGKCECVKAIFPALADGPYSGDIAVESQGILVELIPFTIKVGG